MSRTVWQQRLKTGLLAGVAVVLLLPSAPVTALEEGTVVNSTNGESIASNEPTPEIDDTATVVPTSEVASQDPSDTLSQSVEISEVQSVVIEQPFVVETTDAAVDVVVTPPQYPGVIITQIQTTGGTGHSGEDLIEITNNSSEDVDITNWEVLYVSTTSSTEWKIVLAPTETAIGWHLVLPAHASYLLGTKDLVARHSINGTLFAVDQLFESNIASTAASLRMYDAQKNYQSGVAWGDSTPDKWTEGEPAVLLSSGGIIERKVLENGQYQQTRNNKSDFNDVAHSSLRSSYQTDQVIELFDSCTNLIDIQLSIPEGYYRDSKTGECGDTPPPVPNVCEGLILTEVGANLDEQFIEMQNSGDTPLHLKGCSVQTNRSAAKSYTFGDTTLAPQDYVTIIIADTGLTLTKTTTGTVYLLSGLADEIDTTTYSGLAENTSWALIDGEWQQTYDATPGMANVWQQYLSCQDGYYRNLETGRCNKLAVETALTACTTDQYRSLETGRCRKIEADSSELKPCAANQYRSPETNRCRNITSEDGSTLTACKEGQYRNPETNRCKSIASTTSGLTPCQDGYERNPETNRCRKVQAMLASTPVADFPVEEIKDTGSAFIAWWALGGIVMVGVAYSAWEWRHEIARVVQSAGMHMTGRK